MHAALHTDPYSQPPQASTVGEGGLPLRNQGWNTSLEKALHLAISGIKTLRVSQNRRREKPKTCSLSIVRSSATWTSQESTELTLCQR